MNKSLVKVKIGLIVPGLELGGGVPAVASFIYKVASQRGYRIKIISLSMDSRDAQSTFIAKPSTWFHEPSVRNGIWNTLNLQHVGAKFGDLEFQRYMPRKALAELVKDCDLIQVVSGSPAWANSVLGLGKPVSLQVATRTRVERRHLTAWPFTFLGWWRMVMTFIVDRIDYRALSYVDAIQVENPWMLNYCTSVKAKRTDISYAPPGVDTRLFFPLPNKHQVNTKYILCVGRLSDQRKNIGLLLKSFSLLPSNLSQVNLITAGSTRPPPEYWANVEAMGLLGRVLHISNPEPAELVKLYQEATVFALSSEEEGLGVVILEAMACGIPVVATRCGGPEGIISDGKDGFLVSLGDAHLMADRLSLLCTDAAMNLKMGKAARKTIEARYSEEVAGAKFVNVWDKLLNNTRKI